MINSQKPDKISLGNLIEGIKKGKYVIPDFQREFDWQPWDVRDLVKSIFMDYYIGTLLLWEGKKANYEILDCKPIFAFEGKDNPEYIVLDGQQRLTALHYALFQPNKKFRNKKSRFYYFVKLRSLLAEDYDEAFFYHMETKGYNELLNTPDKQFEDHIFPLGVLKGNLWEFQKWLFSYINYWQNKIQVLKKQTFDTEEEKNNAEKLLGEYNGYVEDTNLIKEIFENILNNYHISYIALDEELKIDKVCEIFTHINSRGVKLDTFDLLNAITRPKEIYLKDMYRQTSQKLGDVEYPGFEMKTQILMVMSILKQRYCSPMYLYYLVPEEIKTIKKPDGTKEKVVLIKSAQEFTALWNVAEETIQKALIALKNPRDFGATRSRFLPYPSIIPALAAVLSHVKDSSYGSMIDVNNKIRQWYWASIFQNKYSSSVESRSTKDFQDIIKWFSDDSDVPEAVVEFHRDYELLPLEKETYSSSAIYKAIFNLFIINGARDWHSFALPEYDEIDDHHIVPKSWGKENGLSQEINSILNRAPLSPDTNRKIINDRLPNQYLKEMFENNSTEEVMKVLNSHLIDEQCVEILLRNPFTPEDYQEFIKHRKSRVLKEIENKIIKLQVDLPADLKKYNDDLEEIELMLRDLIEEKLQIHSIDKLAETIPPHIMEKLKDRVAKEFKKNPALKVEKENQVDFHFEFLDLQELNTIMTSKACWENFAPVFGTKETLTNEFNLLANLRNAIRHSRSVDDITEIKGKSAIMWFKKQLN